MYIVKIRMKSSCLNLGDWYATQESFDTLLGAFRYADLFPRSIFFVTVEM